MKKILLILICVFSTQFLLAQDWKTDFAAAKKEAAKEERKRLIQLKIKEPIADYLFLFFRDQIGVRPV